MKIYLFIILIFIFMQFSDSQVKILFEIWFSFRQT